MSKLPTSSQPFRRVTMLGILFLVFLTIPGQISAPAAASSGTLHLAGPVIVPETLDPAQMRDLSSVVMFRQIYRGLMFYDENLTPVPEIAASYTISDDGLTYDFVLRDNAVFQDGTPITADDVAFSLTRAVDPDTTKGDVSLLSGPAFLSDIAGFNDVYQNTADSFTGINVKSATELTITLVRPQATFLMKLAAVPASIVSKAQVTSDSTWWAKPIGSGPFAVNKWEPDRSLSLDAFDDFYLGEPSLAHISFRLGASALQSFNLYQQGEIDLDSISLNDIDRVADPEGPYADQLVVTPLFALSYLALNPNLAPLDDPWVRAALQLIFPREEFAEVAFDGWVNAATSLIPTQMLAREWATSVPGTSIAAAKAALSKSRYGSGENVPTIRIYGSGVFASVVLKDVAESELGLKIEVLDLQWEDMVTRLSDGNLPAYELYWASDYPDPSGILGALFGTGRPDNYLGYSNPRVDDLLVQAAAENDVDARAELYEQIDQLFMADNVVIPIYTDVDYTVVSPDVHNLLITPMGIIRLETVQIDS
ncbi:MAG TPA: ABC transporter substrate-binding protein [Thermomicrobiales bacterium]|nr:ABC transporter substrate-binding protein [Thermomicrobiales bacterium]